MRAPHQRAVADRDEGAPPVPVAPHAALGNRGRIALLRALSPTAVVAAPDSGWEREAAAAAAGRPDPARVHDDAPAHAASRRLGALAFTADGEIFLSAAMARLAAPQRDRVLGHEQVHANRHPAGGEPGAIVYRAPDDQAPSPEQQHVAEHLQQVLATLPDLSPDQEARLQTALGGVPLFDLLRQRRELVEQHRREAQSVQSVGMGILMHSGPAAERARRITELDKRVTDGLAALGLADEAALIQLVEVEMPAQVLARAKQVALSMLAENERTAKHELDRYGQNVCTPDQAGLLEADRTLQALDVSDQIRRVLLAQANAAATGDQDYLRFQEPDKLGELEEKQRRYEQALSVLALQYPLLRSAGYQPGMFVRADPMQLDAVIAKPVTDVLDNIARVRDAINDDELKVWHIPHAVGIAMLSLGIAGQPVFVSAVRARIQQVETDKAFWGWVKAAFAIGTSILAGIIFTPAVGMLVGAAWGVESLVGNISQYRTESAADQVALDPVLADMSMNEPTLMWIVLDIIGLGLDVAVFAKALRPVAQGLRANPGLATLTRLHDEAIAAGAGTEAADQLTRSAARQFGLNAADVIELTPQTRRAVVTNPAMLAEYERLANERMAAITRDVLRAQRSTPGRLRLQALLQDFQTLRQSIGERALTELERQQAMGILREARDVARADFGTLRTSIWRRMRQDPELERIARDMAGAGDVQLGGRIGSVRVHTVWDEGEEAFQALEVEHKVRLSDNPWRYNDPDNLILTDSAQNQQYLEALRREGGIWATDDVERFIISHGLLDQTNVGAPRGR